MKRVLTQYDNDGVVYIENNVVNIIDTVCNEKMRFPSYYIKGIEVFNVEDSGLLNIVYKTVGEGRFKDSIAIPYTEYAEEELKKILNKNNKIKELVKQIELGEFKDIVGHELTHNQAFIEVKEMLEEEGEEDD